jgi:hypothetical protein
MLTRELCTPFGGHHRGHVASNTSPVISTGGGRGGRASQPSRQARVLFEFWREGPGPQAPRAKPARANGRQQDHCLLHSHHGHCHRNSRSQGSPRPEPEHRRATTTECAGTGMDH